MVNQLFYGDNLEVLRQYIQDETVDLCYIDPPFNSQRNYHQIYNNLGQEYHAQAFIDTWNWDDHAHQGLADILDNYHGHFTQQSIDLISGLTKVLGKGSLLAYLVSMTLRIAEIFRVLKPTGSFYLHCDPTASHYLKLLIDAIFCSQGGDFQNEIIWHYNTGGKGKVRFLRKHDVIFWYSKSKQYQFNRNEISMPRKVGTAHLKYGIDDEGREYYEDFSPRKSGKQYRWYLDEGLTPMDVWIDIQAINPSAGERLGYPTQKPEALLERIIKASSNEGDLILDAYCGSGTTFTVAENLKRKWIGIDISYQSISLILQRLEDKFGPELLDNIQLNGIPKDIKSAVALANKKDDRTRKEFEKWAVLTYTNNRAVINPKKGGVIYFGSEKNDTEKVIFQVKSGKVTSSDIRDFQSTMTLSGAEIGVFITLQEPTKDMIKTAKSAGIYHNKYMTQSCDKINLVTIAEIINEKKRFNFTLVYDVLN